MSRFIKIATFGVVVAATLVTAPASNATQPSSSTSHIPSYSASFAKKNPASKVKPKAKGVARISISSPFKEAALTLTPALGGKSVQVKRGVIRKLKPGMYTVTPVQFDGRLGVASKPVVVVKSGKRTIIELDYSTKLPAGAIVNPSTATPTLGDPIAPDAVSVPATSVSQVGSAVVLTADAPGEPVFVGRVTRIEGDRAIAERAPILEVLPTLSFEYKPTIEEAIAYQSRFPEPAEVDAIDAASSNQLQGRAGFFGTKCSPQLAASLFGTKILFTDVALDATAFPRPQIKSVRFTTELIGGPIARGALEGGALCTKTLGRMDIPIPGVPLLMGFTEIGLESSIKASIEGSLTSPIQPSAALTVELKNGKWSRTVEPGGMEGVRGSIEFTPISLRGRLGLTATPAWLANNGFAEADLAAGIQGSLGVHIKSPYETSQKKRCSIGVWADVAFSAFATARTSFGPVNIGGTIEYPLGALRLAESECPSQKISISGPTVAKTWQNVSYNAANVDGEMLEVRNDSGVVLDSGWIESTNLGIKTAQVDVTFRKSGPQRLNFLVDGKQVGAIDVQVTRGDRGVEIGPFTRDGSWTTTANINCVDVDSSRRCTAYYSLKTLKDGANFDLPMRDSVLNTTAGPQKVNIVATNANSTKNEHLYGRITAEGHDGKMGLAYKGCTSKYMVVYDVPIGANPVSLTVLDGGGAEFTVPIPW